MCKFNCACHGAGTPETPQVCPICKELSVCDHQGWEYDPDKKLREIREAMKGEMPSALSAAPEVIREIWAALRYGHGNEKSRKKAQGILEAYAATLREKLATSQKDIAYLNECMEDKRRLTRKLDVALFGEEGAAKQASLCDLIGPAKDMRIELAELRSKLSTAERQREKAADVLCEIAIIVDAEPGPIPPAVQRLKERAEAAEAQLARVKSLLRESQRCIIEGCGPDCHTRELIDQALQERERKGE